jgi:HSF-type DNA-binding.
MRVSSESATRTHLGIFIQTPQISKFESFTRQVNGWGFKRITQGPDINSYYHELFLRGMPHLIQWMKRVSSTAGGAGKRRLRADPSEEPNFYDISEKYPIPDYYNRNGGRPLSLPTSMKSSFNKLLGGDDDNKDHGKKQLSTRRPLDNSCKTEETSKKNTTVSKQQQENPPSQELDASEFNCCNSSASSSSMVIASSTKKEQCDPTDFEDHVLHDHRAFYQMPMLSPACLSSPPKIIDNLPNLENSQHSSLKDVTSEEFWTRSDAAPYLDPRPVFRTTVHGEEESDLYDAMIAPAVSNEESSESCTNYLLPTNNQWQSICDLLLEDEDLDQESSDIRTSKGSWKKATTV